jgi:hypothetical protein
MKTSNVSQFYDGCCYFKSTYSNFNMVIKLFTLSCLHPHMKSKLAQQVGGILLIANYIHQSLWCANPNH